MGIDNIISAVMHADELNTALTEEYMKQIKEDIKATKKMLKSKTQENISNSQEYSSISANFNSQIFQILKMTPISELDYII